VNGVVPVTPNLRPICDTCDCHKLPQIRICDRICFSFFFIVFLAKRVWSHFGHKCHKWSHFQMWLVHTCLFLLFLGNGQESEWNEIQKNITECDLCLCFMFGIRIRTALTTSSSQIVHQTTDEHGRSAPGKGTYSINNAPPPLSRMRRCVETWELTKKWPIWINISLTRCRRT